MLLLLRPRIVTASDATGTGPGPQGIAAATPRPQGSASAPKAPQGR